jgi:flagellar basal-body rod protein FlgB
MDGNTVELQKEQAEFAENAVRYQATLKFLGGKFKGLRAAIRGD